MNEIRKRNYTHNIWAIIIEKFGINHEILFMTKSSEVTSIKERKISKKKLSKYILILGTISFIVFSSIINI